MSECARAMENGAVYSPTTEAAPGAGRGARSGLAAYFVLGRLPWYRRILKGLQLVSQRRRPGPVGCGLGWMPGGCRSLGFLVREAAVSTPQFLPLLPGKEALPSTAYPWPGLSLLNPFSFLSAKILSLSP